MWFILIAAAGLGLFIVLERVEQHPLQFLWAKTLLAMAYIVLLAFAVISAHLNTALGVLLQSGTVLAIAREHWRAQPASGVEDRGLRECLTRLEGFEAEAEQQRKEARGTASGDYRPDPLPHTEELAERLRPAEQTANLMAEPDAARRTWRRRLRAAWRSA